MTDDPDETPIDIADPGTLARLIMFAGWGSAAFLDDDDAALVLGAAAAFDDAHEGFHLVAHVVQAFAAQGVRVPDGW